MRSPPSSELTFLDLLECIGQVQEPPLSEYVVGCRIGIRLLVRRIDDRYLVGYVGDAATDSQPIDQARKVIAKGNVDVVLSVVFVLVDFRQLHVRVAASNDHAHPIRIGCYG